MERTISEQLLPGSDTDAARVQAVERYRVVGTPPAQVFTRVAALAARFFAAPMATVSIVSHDRIWFLAVRGFPAMQQIAREEGLCGSAIARATPDVIQDALTDPRTDDSRFVREHRIRFFACAPIVSFDGHPLGTVAVMDTEVRSASDEQLAVLGELAAIVMDQLELRLSAIDALGVERRARDAAEYARDYAVLIAKMLSSLATRPTATATTHYWIATTRPRPHYRGIRPGHDGGVSRLSCNKPCFHRCCHRSRVRRSASHDHPASTRRVGGDFYDVFPLGDNRWAFFIGDVEGHGVAAAVATSLIRLHPAFCRTALQRPHRRARRTQLGAAARVWIHDVSARSCPEASSHIPTAKASGSPLPPVVTRRRSSWTPPAESR